MKYELRAQQILVVDDMADIRLTLSQYLRSAGYHVHTAENGAQALEYVDKYGLPDLVVLDIVMPGLNGFDVADMLRARGAVPIVFVSVLDDTDTKVAVLRQYGDDYITKPVNQGIFISRIRRVLQWYANSGHIRQEIEVTSTISANFEEHYIVINGHIENLTPAESDILQTLVECRGKIVSQERLLTKVKSVNALFVHIRRLRSKIETNPSKPRVLHTARGQGYFLT